MSVDISRLIKELKNGSFLHCEKTKHGEPCIMKPREGMSAPGIVRVKGSVCNNEETWDADKLELYINKFKGVTIDLLKDIRKKGIV